MQASDSCAVREFCGAIRERPRLLEEMQEFTTRTIHTSRLEKVAIAPDFRVHLRTRAVRGFTLLRGETNGTRAIEVRDTRAIERDGSDQFALVLNMRGETKLHQFGRAQPVAAGCYALVRTSRPFIHEAQTAGGGDGMTFFMPGEFVNQRVVLSERLCLGSSRARQGFHDLVFGTVRLFEQNAWSFTADQFESAARVVADLVLVGLDRSADVFSGEASVRAANLARVKHIIGARCPEPHLSLADVAQEAGLSLSYLHKLFRDERCTVYEYLKGERLQRARELLELAPSRKMTVTDVAYECGFADPAHFSRCFKQAFGISPRDVPQRASLTSERESLARAHIQDPDRAQ